jgi:hypothetical protein
MGDLPHIVWKISMARRSENRCPAGASVWARWPRYGPAPAGPITQSGWSIVAGEGLTYRRRRDMGGALTELVTA